MPIGITNLKLKTKQKLLKIRCIGAGIYKKRSFKLCTIYSKPFAVDRLPPPKPILQNFPVVQLDPQDVSLLARQG